MRSPESWTSLYLFRLSQAQMSKKAKELEEKAWVLLKNGKKDLAVNTFYEASKAADTLKQKQLLRHRGELIMKGVLTWNKDSGHWEIK